MTIREHAYISGKVRIDVFQAGLVAEVRPYVAQLKALRRNEAPELQARLIAKIEKIKTFRFLHTAVACPNLIMDSTNHGIDLLIQYLIDNIQYAEIGTGSTTPTLSDTALTTPTNRAAVGFSQNYGSTDAIFQFFFADSQLANETYNEAGAFMNGTTTIGSGDLFNHALLVPAFTKTAGTDATLQLDVSFANA